MKKVMSIDDSASFRSHLADILKGSFKVVQAQEGYDAYCKIQEIGDISVFCLDYYMPGNFNGDRVLKEIRRVKNYKKTPVVIISSAISEALMKETEDLGVSYYLAKPVDKEKFLELIKELAG